MGRSRKNVGRSRKDLNKKAVAERMKYRAELSPAQQLSRLDSRLGKGIGAKKERERLAKKS